GRRAGARQQRPPSAAAVAPALLRCAARHRGLLGGGPRPRGARSQREPEGRRRLGGAALMSDTPARPFVSVKFTPGGRRQSFLLPDLLLDQNVRPGDDVVVEGAEGQGVGSIVRMPSALAERRRPVAGAAASVVRRASHSDLLQKL